MIAALRRLGLVLFILFGGTILVSLALGWFFGASAQRFVSLGLDIVGSFLLVIGFFIGVRGPFRLGGSDMPGSGSRSVRWAQPDEQRRRQSFGALRDGRTRARLRRPRDRSALQPF